MTDNPTVWYKSKTFWLGVTQIIIGILTALQAQLETGVTLTLFGILTIILRVVTNTPMVFKLE
jgi:uncharacterized membrane protein